MDLQSTLLKGVVRSSEDGLFYLFPIQSLSTLQEMKGHLTCAIDVLSNPDESDVEKRLDAVRTLNSLVAALSVNDGDHYDVIDTAFEEIREKTERYNKSLPISKPEKRKVLYCPMCDSSRLFVQHFSAVLYG